MEKFLGYRSFRFGLGIPPASSAREQTVRVQDERFLITSGDPHCRYGEIFHDTVQPVAVYKPDARTVS
jgi:hypothetical protein